MPRQKMVSELIRKYIFLIQILSAAGERGLSLEEISLKYESRFRQPYSRKSFNNHRAAVEEIFGIEIKCDRSDNHYSIPFTEDALDEDKSLRWIVNTFTVNSLLTLSKERLSGRVSVEEIPSGQKNLTAIMQAMQDGKELEIAYSKYKASTAEILHIQPFALLERERRWYLVAFCQERAANQDGSIARNSDRNAWRVYGLDRINSMREMESPFKMPEGFDVDELFSQSYGTFFPIAGQKPVTIRLRATEEEAKYLRDLPLHSSQREEKNGEGLPVFNIRVIPNINLIMDLCKRGNRIEVLEPESVRKEVAEEHKKALGLYFKQI